jgi:hypothetical protein
VKNLKLIFFVILISCTAGSSSVYNSNILLNPVRVKSIHNIFSLELPYNWYSTNPDNEAGFELWLNDSDNSKTITITPINFAEEEKPDHETLYDFVKEFKLSASHPKAKILNEEKFNFGKTNIFAFTYQLNESDIRRTLVFNIGLKFYECTAMTTGKNVTDQETNANLFSLQNSLIKSINIL